MLKKLIKNKANLLYCAVFILLMPCYAYAAQVENQNRMQDNDKAGGGALDKEERTYIYDPRGKTDPFKPFIAIREQVAEKEREKPKTYLETLELSQLDLSVIIIGKKGKWAMVTDSKDMGHVIKEGTPIGTNGGVVYKIKPGEVVIREEYRNFKGEKEYRDISKKTTPAEK